jgi:hypothetical protein
MYLLHNGVNCADSVKLLHFVLIPMDKLTFFFISYTIFSPSLDISTLWCMLITLTSCKVGAVTFESYLYVEVSTNKKI